MIQQDTALTTFFSFYIFNKLIMKICLNIETEEKRLVDVTEQPTKFSSSFYTDQTREIKIIREAFNSNNFT